VVAAAEVLADDVGLPQLTLAALADSLGVRQPSLYKHIGGMDDLQRSMSVRAKQELGDVLSRAAVGKARGDAVRAISDAYRGWAAQHPGRYAAAQRVPDPADAADIAASDGVVSVVVDVLAGYQLAGDEAIDATRSLRAALHGWVTLANADGFGLPRDVDRSFEFLVGVFVAAFESRPAAPRHAHDA
jgi:AcrR family transcriptional regulator